MKKKVLIGAGMVALAAFLAYVPFAFADRTMMHRDGMMGGGPGMAFFGHLRHLKSDLNLTDDQVTQIKAIAQSLRDQNAQYRDQLHGGMQQVAQTLIKDPSNVAAAQAIIDGQSTAENAMKKNALNAASKALQVLTADQRAKLGDALATMSANARGHRRGLFR